MSSKESEVDLEDNLGRRVELREETGDQEVGRLRSGNVVEPDADPTKLDNVLLRITRVDEVGEVANELRRHVAELDSEFLLVESADVGSSRE